MDIRSAFPIVIIVLILPFLIVGCDSNPFGVLFGKTGGRFECRVVEPSEGSSDRITTLDDRLASISHSVDGGFGGHYYNREEDALTIYMLEPDNQEAAQEIRSRLTSLHGTNSEWANTTLGVKKGQYTVHQLLEWKDLSTNIMSFQGVNSQDLNEGGNEITFGISTEADDPEAVENCVLKNADNLGIPREAIGIEMSPPVRRLPGS